MTRNVAYFRSLRVRVVKHLPAQVRKELSAGVKLGHLGHMRKKGLMPEVYFHPEHIEEAHAIRSQEAFAGIQAIARVCV